MIQSKGSGGQAQSFPLTHCKYQYSDQKVLRAHRAQMFPEREAWPRPRLDRRASCPPRPAGSPPDLWLLKAQAARTPRSLRVHIWAASLRTRP